MDMRMKNGSVYRDGLFFREDLLCSNGIIVPAPTIDPAARIADISDMVIFPGFADVHVHLREPGFSYKETMGSGTAAAARGGYTAVCPMPNLSPVPEDEASLREELTAIERDAKIAVHPYGAITRGEKGEHLADMDAVAAKVVAFSDDGKGVQSESMMRAAMEKAASLGKMIVAHCEDESLLRGGYIHDGDYAAAHGHRGICSESEWRQVERDLRLVKETGCAYHVCHVSTAESVALLRQAKAEGLNVSCETAPHYLLLCEDDLQEHGRFKMNPPLRTKRDREALIEGILDGTVDVIATDHAPHSAEEKSRGLEKILMGVVGLETAFPLLYTYLVKPGVVSLRRLTELLCTAPRARFALGGGSLNPGDEASFTVFDLNAEYPVDPTEFLSMGRSTPFEGWSVYGRCRMTVYRGEVVWDDHTVRQTAE